MPFDLVQIMSRNPDRSNARAARTLDRANSEFAEEQIQIV